MESSASTKLTANWFSKLVEHMVDLASVVTLNQEAEQSITMGMDQRFRRKYRGVPAKWSEAAHSS